MSTKAMQPSPLKPSLNGPELLKLETLLFWESVYSFGKCNLIIQKSIIIQLFIVDCSFPSFVASSCSPMASSSLATVIGSEDQDEQIDGSRNQYQILDDINYNNDFNGLDTNSYNSRGSRYVFLEGPHAGRSVDMYEDLLLMTPRLHSGAEEDRIEHVLKDMGFSEALINQAKRKYVIHFSFHILYM